MKKRKRRYLITYPSALLSPLELFSYFDIFLERQLKKLFDDYDVSMLRIETKCKAITEDNNNVYVEINVPGFEKSEFDINIEDKYINISAKKEIKEEKKEAETAVYLAYRLPSKVDITNAKATYINGMLKITLPKSKEKEDETKQIKIE